MLAILNEPYRTHLTPHFKNMWQEGNDVHSSPEKFCIFKQSNIFSMNNLGLKKYKNLDPKVHYHVVYKILTEEPSNKKDGHPAHLFFQSLLY